jgi:5-methylcytosine-specific restriction endonuclease McrA
MTFTGRKIIVSKEVLIMKVFVQDKNGNPLDPTSPARARKLLDRVRAKIVQRNPFIIKIIDRKKENSYIHNVTLGIDAGYKEVGFSAINEDEELISGVLELRNNISKKLEQKSNYRRNRRHRNTKYRQPRFNNRKNSKPKCWLAPSLRHKKDSHIKLVNKLKNLLPITKVIVEVAKFDQQKMQNPEINGIEYQQGTLQGYNVRNYLLEKFDYKCIYCGKKNIPLEVEHIIPKSRGGSNRVDNLTISCHDCNQEKDNQTAEEFGCPNVQKQAKKTLKSTAFMNIVRWKIVNKLDCEYTFGHITKKKRIKQGLEKTHYNDAFIITGGNDQQRINPTNVIIRRRNNRSIQTNRKSHGRSIRKQKYPLSPGDLVKYENEVCEVKGMFNYGKWVRMKDSDDNTVNSNVKNVKLVKYRKGLYFVS